MLQNEVKVLKRLKHANLLQLLAYTEEKKHCCLLYPYMESGNLRKLLEKTSINQNGLSWNASQKIILGLADGLKYLHHLEYVHLDIKPFTLVFSNGNEESDLKITDFTFAKRLTAFCQPNLSGWYFKRTDSYM